jgi:hypothetical protein
MLNKIIYLLLVLLFILIGINGFNKESIGDFLFILILILLNYKINKNNTK